MSGAAEDLMLMTRENQALTSELIDRWLDGECDDDENMSMIMLMVLLILTISSCCIHYM